MADLTQQELAQLITGIDGAVLATDIDTEKSNKSIAIIGPPKSGKSWLAATIAKAVGPTYVFDFDNRADSIAGKPNIIVRTYTDVVQSQPQAFKKLEEHIEQFKYKKTCGEPIPAAYIVDSVTFLKRIVENEFFQQQKNTKIKMFREVKLSGNNNSVYIPEGWDVINGVRDYCLYLFAELRALGHIIVVFHERPITDKVLSTPERPVYTGKIGIDPPYLNSLLSVFNDVWRISMDAAGNYIVFVKANPNFDGATSLRGLDPVENADIAEMLQKNAAAIAKM